MSLSPPLCRPAGSLGLSSDVFIMDSIGGGAVSLGDLADLTVTNDNELSCDVSHPCCVPRPGPVFPCFVPKTSPERPLSPVSPVTFPDAALSVPLALLLLLTSPNLFVRVSSVFLHPAVAPKRPPVSPKSPLSPATL